MYDGIDAYNELYFPYDSDAEYRVEAYPNLTAKVRHDYGDTYEDYYNYLFWTSGEPVHYPNWFDFFGPGPDVEADGSNILLGAVYGLFVGGSQVGPPDHVRVISDTGNVPHDPDCGFPDRRITVQLVDAYGRRAVALLQSVSVRERFFSAGSGMEVYCVWSSCTDDCIRPTARQFTNLGGTFTDHLTAGCPPPPFPTSCGISEFVDKWIWSPRGLPEKILTTNVYDVTSQHALINGQGYYSPGTELR